MKSLNGRDCLGSYAPNFYGKEIRSNIFACVLPCREEVKQAVKTACEELQKKINLEASE